MFGLGLLLQLKLRELGASLLMVGLLTTVRGAVETFGSPAWERYLTDLRNENY